MKKRKLLIILSFSIIALMVLVGNNVFCAENIESDSQYAWGENVGWINLEPGGDGGQGVEVGDSTLTGYMWGENIGWINLSPTEGGVVNDVCGNLSGYAWSENVGWINFAGVTVDPTTGDFSGYAWGENIGWINFDGIKTSWRGDADGDGHCSDVDCDDSDPAVNPDAIEIPYNGKDDDCNAATLDDDLDGDGHLIATDCDDTDSTVNPLAIEVCDGIDNNCNENIDEGLPQYTYYEDGDLDGYGNSASALDTCFASPPTGYVSNSTDCDDIDSNVYPGATEVCNGKDDNCDVVVDEGVKTTFYMDLDTDGYGDPNSSTEGCIAPEGYVADNTDCNDNNSAVNPGAEEVCDGVDNNCDENIDEGLDQDNDGFADCFDNCPNTPNPDQSDVDENGAGDVCDICPSDSSDTCDQSGSAGDTIGVDGGLITAGTTTVDIPADALTADTSISITSYDPTVTDAGFVVGDKFQTVGNVYDLQPKVIFKEPVTITFIYEQGDMVECGAIEQHLDIYRWNGAIWEPQNATQNCASNTLTITTKQFSFYMVALLGGKSIKADVVTNLKDAGTGNRKVDRVINRMIKIINWSLRDAYWQDEFHLNDRHGRKVFNYESLAVAATKLHIRHWNRRGPTPAQAKAIKAFEAAIPILVHVDRMLAEMAISEAKELSPPSKPWRRKAFERYRSRADKAFERALVYVEKGKPTLAIELFKRAWNYARIAKKLAQ